MGRFTLFAIALCELLQVTASLAGPAPLTAHPELPAERRALWRSGSEERWVDAEEARRAGYTLVDLSDQWTPYIFALHVDSAGQPLPSRYRAVFLGLASDTGDGDGQPLPAGQHNYLELYGIPPTLGVLRARFLEDEADRCRAVDWSKIRAVTSIPLREPKAEQKEQARLARLERQLEQARTVAHLATLEELAAAQPKLASDVQAIVRNRAAAAAFPEVERRLACEGLLSDKGASRARHQSGRFDETMREALIRFQHKHKIYDAAALRKETMAALGRPPLDNDHAALVRALTERAVSAASILEDGSVDTKSGPPSYEDASGRRVLVRNLVDEAMTATIEQLGLTTPADALAFFKRHGAAELQSLRAAVKLPPPPEYYGPAMDLSVVIDRGDVFYDPPYDDSGKHLDQSRHHFPMLTLRVRHRDQLIPLARWRTTIGGWRSDLASNGYEYFRYKGSDVGPRVWRNIVAGPVWIAPNSTPLRTLVKNKLVRGHWQTVVNYDEVGPGYLSAYGLVAAYNVVPGKDGRPDWDNGVRVHGSSEYRSIRDPEGYSHGCHRLVNHLAVRLFSFVLQHRNKALEGDKPLGFSRDFLWKDDVYVMRLPTRGFWYTLDPPLPVNVLEGNILGKEKKPVPGYVPKPGVVYPPGPLPLPPDSPEAKAGGGDAKNESKGDSGEEAP